MTKKYVFEPIAAKVACVGGHDVEIYPLAHGFGAYCPAIRGGQMLAAASSEEETLRLAALELGFKMCVVEE